MATKNIKQTNKPTVFDADGIPPLKHLAPLGFQHVAAAIIGIVTPAIMVANVCKLSEQDAVLLIQAALVMSAVSTFLQCGNFFGIIGSKLPVLFGTSFAYVPTLLALGAEFDIATIFGSQIIGGIIAFLVGIFIKYLRVFFPPLVAGTVVFSIGLSLYPTAVKYMAGGAGSTDFGSIQNWTVAIITFAVVLALTYFSKGFLKLASLLIGIGVGYAVAYSMGMVSFAKVSAAGWFALPMPLHFGIKFEPVAIATMAIVFIVNSVQAIGDFTATTVGGFDRQPTDKELSGGIAANGLGNVISAIFGGLPSASYSQNVGLVATTKVVNRYVIIFAAAILAIAGFVPKFSGILTTIPSAVLGGATISVFASIAMTGIKVIVEENMTARNTAVVGLSIALGSGIVQVSGCLSGMPAWVMTVFGSSSVVITTILAVVLNIILPKDK
ncbi:MAG: nucleobase:cation symporter-2 family protein [Oscillospiraceae bacterium]